MFTFAGNNFNPSSGGNITEIGILDSQDTNGTFFAVIQVPTITKTNKVSQNKPKQAKKPIVTRNKTNKK